MMNKKMHAVEIVDQKCVTAGFYLIVLEAPESFLGSVPGQFIMIRFPDNDSVFLPRPFSIHSIYERGNRIFCEILYQTIGKGSTLLSRLRPGEQVLVNGPLGRGFRLEDHLDVVIFIAGGMGAAPLRYLAEKIQTSAYPSKEIVCYLGARNKELVPDMPVLKNICTRFNVSTDDGSLGYHGLVTDFFAGDLSLYQGRNAMVYACGPHAMLKNLKNILEGSRIKCQVSVEEKMACGIGACLGCAVQSAEGDYKCVCKDGPVFDLDELAW